MRGGGRTNASFGRGLIKMSRTTPILAALIGVLAHASAAAAQDFDYSALQSEPTPQRVGEIIDEIARSGRGDHHFLLSYCTSSPGVVLPPDVRSRHPVEITIILEWQYWDLQRVDDEVRVTVSFDSQIERIVIPLDALTHFSDPVADVSIWLQPGRTSEERCATRAYGV